MNEYFISRDYCPACKGLENITLYENSFTDPPIKEYLESFYSPQGGVEFEYLVNVNFTIKECNHCGLIYQKNIPNNFLMHKIYEEWLDPKKTFEMIASKSNLGYLINLMKQIINMIEYVGNIPDKLDFFDFGIGWGHWCRIAKALGCNAFGTELSQARIDYAQSLGVKVISWEEIPDYKFDLINIEQTLEHISEPLETLICLKNALKPNGILRISVPDGWDIQRRLRIGDWQTSKSSKNSLNPIAPLEHINCFNHKALVYIVNNVGLEMVRIPEKYTFSLKDKIKSILKPYYYLLRRQGGTTLYFRQSQ